ncbi:hypothetical protein Tsubulata_003855, partial [Turnera subulata]
VNKETRVEVAEETQEAFFQEENLEVIEGFNKGADYVEVKCGCTSRRYGDTVGMLRVYANGKFIISCDCTERCGGKFTPFEFEKHSGKEGNKEWTGHIWVLVNDKKVPLRRTGLLKYYKHSSNGASGSSRRNFHRDEFVRCCKCKKKRRFRLRSKEDCRIYHDALANKRWKCADRPYDRISCKHVEERASRIAYRGCSHQSKCEGCGFCVCFGCLKCRFVDCHCRTCTDFMQNAPPSI